MIKFLFLIINVARDIIFYKKYTHSMVMSNLGILWIDMYFDLLYCKKLLFDYSYDMFLDTITP